MSEGALIAGKFIAALAVLSEAERARALDVTLMAFPDYARKTHNRERMRTKRAHEAHKSAPDAHETSTGDARSAFEGVGGVSLSDLGSRPGLENLPLSGLSSGDLGQSPGARESAVVPALGGAPSFLAAALFAYEAGISSGRGAPFCVPRGQREDVLECIRVHGRDAQGPYAGATLQAWLQTDGAAFASWLKAMPRAEYDRAHWNYNPRAFLRWLNDNAERVAAEAVHEAPSAVMPIAGTRRPLDAPAGAASMFGALAAKGGG